MKPLSKDEVAAIMKKEVPILLHKRIAELEKALESALETAACIGELHPQTRKELAGILKKGVSL